MTQREFPPQASLTTGNVARILGVSVDRVRQLARSGRLAFSDTPYGRLFDPADVEAARQRYATDRARAGGDR